MATTEGYKGSVEIGSGLSCPAGHDFPLVAAHQILARSNKRLSDVLQEYDERFQSGGGSGGTGDSVTVPDSSASTPLEYFTFSKVIGSELELAVSIDNADLSTISFPSIYDGKPVTRISSANVPNATVIRIPEGIAVIEPQAFAKNEKLEVLVLPNSILSIETMAFMQLTALRELYIPKNVRSIYAMAVSPTRQPNLTVYCASEKAGTLWQDSWNGTSDKVPVEWNCSSDGLESRFVLRARIADAAKEADNAKRAETAETAEHADTATQAGMTDSLRVKRIPIRQTKSVTNGNTVSFDLRGCPDFSRVIGLAFDLKFACESTYTRTDIPICETCFGNITTRDDSIGVIVNRTLGGFSEPTGSRFSSGSVAFSSQIKLEIVRVNVAARVNITPNLRYLIDYTPHTTPLWEDWDDEDSLGLYVGDIILIYGESSDISLV